MNFTEFEESLAGEAPPSGVPELLVALWHCKKGHWDAAHDIAQDVSSRLGSRVHGLLHLIEGDKGNAAYWYARAGVPAVQDSREIDAEWRRCVQAVVEPG